MTDVVRDWLPPGAVSGDLARAKVRGALEAWSAHWFAKRSYNPGRLTERLVSPGLDGWRRVGRMCAVRCPASASSKLIEAALDLQVAATVFTEHDKRLLETFTEVLLDDLAARLERALSVNASQLGRPAESGPAEHWLDVAVGEGQGPDLFQVAIPVRMVAPLLKTSATRRPSEPLDHLKDAITGVEVMLEVTLGSVVVSMPDLAGLSAGDILVLPTVIDQALAVARVGSDHPIAYAKLADYGGTMALSFQSEA